MPNLAAAVSSRREGATSDVVADMHAGCHARTSLQQSIVPRVFVSTMLIRSCTLFSANGT